MVVSTSINLLQRLFYRTTVEPPAVRKELRRRERHIIYRITAIGRTISGMLSLPLDVILKDEKIQNRTIEVNLSHFLIFGAREKEDNFIIIIIYLFIYLFAGRFVLRKIKNKSQKEYKMSNGQAVVHDKLEKIAFLSSFTIATPLNLPKYIQVSHWVVGSILFCVVSLVLLPELSIFTTLLRRMEIGSKGGKKNSHKAHIITDKKIIAKTKNENNNYNYNSENKKLTGSILSYLEKREIEMFLMFHSHLFIPFLLRTSFIKLKILMMRNVNLLFKNDNIVVFFLFVFCGGGWVWCHGGWVGEKRDSGRGVKGPGPITPAHPLSKLNECFSACCEDLKRGHVWREEDEPGPYLGPQPPQDHRNEKGNARKSPRGLLATADMKQRTARFAESSRRRRPSPPTTPPSGGNSREQHTPGPPDASRLRKERPRLFPTFLSFRLNGSPRNLFERRENRKEEGNVRKSLRGRGATADMKQRTARCTESSQRRRPSPPTTSSSGDKSREQHTPASPDASRLRMLSPSPQNPEKGRVEVELLLIPPQPRRQLEEEMASQLDLMGSSAAMALAHHLGGGDANTASDRQEANAGWEEHAPAQPQHLPEAHAPQLPPNEENAHSNGAPLPRLASLPEPCAGAAEDDEEAQARECWENNSEALKFFLRALRVLFGVLFARSAGASLPRALLQQEIIIVVVIIIVFSKPFAFGHPHLASEEAGRRGGVFLLLPIGWKVKFSKLSVYNTAVIIIIIILILLFVKQNDKHNDIRSKGGKRSISIFSMFLGFVAFFLSLVFYIHIAPRNYVFNRFPTHSQIALTYLFLTLYCSLYWITSSSLSS
eukprot:gene8679-6102_t